MATVTQVQVTFDCANPRAVAEFWKAALGYVDPPVPAGFDSWDAYEASLPVESRGSSWACQDPDGVGPRLYFQRVPEAKTVKNRLHLDVRVGQDRIEAERDRLVAAGATYLHDGQEGPSRWFTLADPEGNEFCVT
jgi:hypothetical protein